MPALFRNEERSQDVCHGVYVGCGPLQPRRGAIQQPRATPWERVANPPSHALKGHNSPAFRPAITPLQGYSVDLAPVSQGDALGYRITPLRG
jgi:hypothetical protein